MVVENIRVLELSTGTPSTYFSTVRTGHGRRTCWKVGTADGRLLLYKQEATDFVHHQHVVWHSLPLPSPLTPMIRAVVKHYSPAAMSSNLFRNTSNIDSGRKVSPSFEDHARNVEGRASSCLSDNDPRARGSEEQTTELTMAAFLPLMCWRSCRRASG